MSLALAREVGYPAGEALALAQLSHGRHAAPMTWAAPCGWPGRPSRSRPTSPAGSARSCSYVLTEVLTEAGDLAAAERVCAAGLARSRDAGDLWNQAGLLPRMAILDLQAGRVQDAAAHLREALQIAVRAGGAVELINGLDCCGYLCAATGRCAEAVTVWAAFAALLRHEGFTDVPADARRRQSRCARPGRRSDPPGPARPRNAARR